MLAKAPIRFEPNRGQVRTSSSDPVQWVARGLNYDFLFSAQSSVLRFKNHALRMTLEGSSSKAAFVPTEETASTTQYLTAGYRGRLEGFRKLHREGIYPGVDLVYYGSGQHLEYDFQVAAGADPSAIRIRFEGADGIRLTDAGNIELQLGSETMTQLRPVIYQVAKDGSHVPVQGAYRIAEDGAIAIAMDRYDRSLPMVIDPLIATPVFSRYLFGTATDESIAVAHDPNGFIYLAGITLSTDFYIQGIYFSIGNEGGQDVWLQKLNPVATDGNYELYTTYYGGTGDETVEGLAVDANGRMYITGTTDSINLPLANAYTTTNEGNTTYLVGFVAEFDPTVSGTPSLLYATYINGNTAVDLRSIAVANGKIFVTGSTAASDYPAVGAIQASSFAGIEVVVSEIDPTKSGTSSLVFSTYLDGSADDLARSIAVDSNGFVYVSGITYSPDFQQTSNAYQTSYNGAGEVFVVKLDLTKPAVVYGTYIGGSLTDEPRRILADASGKVAIAGYTLSPDYPVTQNAYQSQNHGVANAFLTILDTTAAPGNALVYSTFFGGSFADVAYDMARDSAGRYYLGGYSMSTDLPTTVNAMNVVSGGGGIDGWIAVLDLTQPALNALVYSSYVTGLGNQLVAGVDVAPSGLVSITGSATANIFPPGQAVKPTLDGNLDGFYLGFTLSQPNATQSVRALPAGRFRPSLVSSPLGDRLRASPASQ